MHNGGMFLTWDELNCWSRLPRDHPHIVPFDSVVLDPHTHGIVGFTTRYIPGGTLHANNATKRPFRLGWLRQLLSAVDDLNCRYGVMHQDIAPRNILIDERDNLRILDFDDAIMIGKDYTPDLDDAKGVVFTLYEIITLDEHFRELPHKQQDPEVVLTMETWAKHPDVKLDADVAEFRAVLGEWVAQRKAREFFQPTETWVRWTEMPEPPVVTVPTYEYHKGGGKTITGTKTGPRDVVTRQQLVDLGAEYWDWERPASYKLREALPEED
jgi:serine/threonine protein kinase